jgi:hypothetical protein
MSKVLIIDDTDPSINWSGNWQTTGTITGTSHEYNSTLHRGDTIDQSFTYTFNGTGISVYGSLDTPATNGLPGVQFQVDGLETQQTNATGAITYELGRLETHQVLYKSPALSAGTHTIKVQVTNATTNGPYLYFDFFTIDTGLESVAGHVILDDRDETIDYFPEWIKAGVGQEYMNTTMWPPSPDSYITVKFNGMHVSYLL